MHVLYLGGTARAALVRKRSYLGLSDEKTTVPLVPFRVLVLPLPIGLRANNPPYVTIPYEPPRMRSNHHPLNDDTVVHNTMIV